MTKVIFKFDKEKDLYNHWDLSNIGNSFKKNFQIDPQIRKICEGKKFDECKNKLADYLLSLHKSKIIFINIKTVEKTWEEMEDSFFKRMDKLMKNVFREKIIAYLTTAGTCPYDPDELSFMFSLFYSLPKNLQTCGHEIMHLYFHKFYWEKVEKQIGKEKTADLKEALTVLLNLEFKDLWFVEDTGYEQHRELRKFIVKEWKKEKDFEILLSKCVRYLKN